ncbi:MAG: hypothetical protein PWP04_253 [Candidatus Atribacteria bacterium]|nr:hypothetical protein [Candidatus Atribacteria bacterium]
MKKNQFLAKNSLFFYLLIFSLLLCFSTTVFAAVKGEQFVSFLENTFELSRRSLSYDFSLENPITRYQAASLVIQALGYDDLIPFIDLAGYSTNHPEIVLASTLRPPLLVGDERGDFRPNDLLTEQEFSFLQPRIREYAQGRISWSTTISVEPGIELMVKKRGVAATKAIDGFWLQVGAFSEEARAQNQSQWLKELGYSTSVVVEDNLFKVRVGPLAPEEVSLTQSRLQKQGFPAFPLSSSVSLSEGPVFSLALIFNPATSSRQLEVALAGDTILERETVSQIAKRKGAFFATNGSFFATDGTPIGFLMIDGKILSEPQNGWYVCGIQPDGHLLFDQLKWQGEVIVSGEERGFPLSGINRANRGEEIVLYTRDYGAKTPVQEGVECVIAQGVVQKVGKSPGGSPLPPQGVIIQGKGRGESWMMNFLRSGLPIRVVFRIYPLRGEVEDWGGVRYALSGGPLLFQDGQPGPWGEFNEDIVKKKHPRTVIGQREDGAVVFLVVDGRNQKHSAGLTIPELVEELKDYRLLNALNLDGGGSTTFYLQGKILNQPTDLIGERKISTALILK